MGYSCNSVGSLINLSLLISLLLISSTEVVCLVKGIAISRLLEVAAKVGNEQKMFVRTQIGSRPPSCLRRCSSCGPCQAIQVPAVPQVGSGVKGHSSPKATISSRAEDTSNYKPMNWKCKCGDRIFNP
ncbi:hypothetical protein MRB53_007160 [Persea americana]|uniref:Uncharacterized protein n=1 Tax=Persea americana TaxID=3435 RepID=A0ACC2MI72_PERAE|nr:hypothetical protein MRB53_007160 [Persea americana]